MCADVIQFMKLKIAKKQKNHAHLHVAVQHAAKDQPRRVEHVPQHTVQLTWRQHQSLLTDHISKHVTTAVSV